MGIYKEDITKEKCLSKGNHVPKLRLIYGFKKSFQNCAHSYMDKNAGAEILHAPNYYGY